MKHVIVGLISAGLAIWGLVVWWANFGRVMRGLIPFLLLIFALVSIASGLRRIQAAKSQDNTISNNGKTSATESSPTS